MDLQDFFVNIGGARVYAMFRTLGYPKEAAQVLTGLCISRVPAQAFQVRDPTKCDFELPRTDWLTRKRYQAAHLPQGAPTSPTLANLCAFNLDLRLQAAAEAMDARYTRYADDLTFSGGRQLEQAAQRFTLLVGAIAAEEGFAINFRKTRLMTRSQRQQVTGIVVNENTNLSRRNRDELKATLTNCLRHGAASQNRSGVTDFRAHLAGRVAHLAMINPARGQRIKELFDRIVW